MLDFLQKLFMSGGFMPHGHCYLWTPGIVWLHVVSDALIALAYYSIPLSLAWFVRRRLDIDFRWMFVCFAVFILACGTTHLMEIWNVWHGNYWLSGVIKALTAAASVPTAILLTRLMPQALALPSPAALARANATLEEEIRMHRRAQESLDRLNAELERRVAERTSDLNAANGELLRQIAERQQAEEALRARELDFRASFYSSAVGQAQVEPETGRYLRANPKFCEITGYSEEELLRMTFSELTHPEDREHDTTAHERMVRGETQEVTREKRYRRKDGTTVWVDIHASLIRDEGGRPLRTLAVVQDITARKEAEAARNRAEEKFRCLVEQSLVGIYVIQGDRFVYVNPKMAEIYGRSPEALTSAPVTDFVHPEDRALVRQNIEKRLTGVAQSIHYPLRVLRPDGTVFFVETHGGRTEYNGTPAILGSLLDITERISAEEALKASLQQITDLKTALDEHAIVAVTDPQGKITFVNDKFCAISKYSREELLGRDHRVINSGHHPKEFIRDLWTTIARGKVWHGEIRNRAKDGSFYWVDTTIVPFLNEQGKPHHYIAIRADITERKRAEEEIHRLNTELEQRVAERTTQLEAANKELEAFSYSVSHDLRSPLRAVDGFSRAVEEDYGPQLPTEGQRYLRIIREGAQRMGMLIDDLLTFSRLSRLPLRKQAVDTQRQVRATLDELLAAHSGRAIDIQLGDLPPCDGDPALLRQVWANLLSNALKYTGKRAEATVEIGALQERSATVYFVRDNGTGFDMRYAEKLFGVFQRLHRQEEFDGTGVGLAIVQRIVHRHGGRIWAEAALDRGATFYFTLEGETNL
jgi:PAS domain S-box-containing protein